MGKNKGQSSILEIWCVVGVNELFHSSKEPETVNINV